MFVHVEKEKYIKESTERWLSNVVLNYEVLNYNAFASFAKIIMGRSAEVFRDRPTAHDGVTTCIKPYMRAWAWEFMPLLPPRMTA